MADLSDVENALTALIAGALFPTISYLPGDYQPSAALAVPIPTALVPTPTIAPIIVKLYRGWPESANLNADLAISRAHVSVFSEQGMTRNVSRWQPTPVLVTANVPTITVAVSGATVTLGGSVTVGNVVGVQFGAPNAAYAYMAQSGDTLTTVAAAIATKAGATSSGAVITLPVAIYTGAGVMVAQTAITIVGQQEQGIRISIWAATPPARDAIASLIGSALEGMRNTYGALTRFFPVGAYEAARIVYRSSFTNDLPARDRVWRRDLCYTVEYSTTLIEQDPAALFIGGPFWTNGVLNQFGAEEPSGSLATQSDNQSIYLDAAGNIIGSQSTV